MELRFADGSWAVGRVVGTDAYTDLAVVAVDDLPESAKPLPVAPENPLPGRPVAALGNPLGLDGSITAGMAIYDTMQYIKSDVSTICVGLAASMGSFLLAGGAAGKRASLPNSRIMIHQPLGGAQGQATDIEIQAKEILRMRDLLEDILADHTGQPKEKITKDTDRDFVLSATEALEYGIIDEVISGRELADKTGPITAAS